MSEILVLCWFWRQPGGRTKYHPSHVNTWAAMVRRNLSMPHRIACVTDTPSGIDKSIEIIAPPGDFMDINNPRWSNGRPQCYRRLSMYRRDAAKLFGDRFVCMDIDCVIGGQLDPLFERDEDLVLFRGTSRNRPYNGSMQMIRAGCRPDIFEDFNQQAALESGRFFCGSDQAWLMHKLGPSEAVWDEKDGVYWFGGAYRRATRPAPPRIVFFPGSMKPWSARFVDPYFRENYRIEEAA